MSSGCRGRSRSRRCAPSCSRGPARAAAHSAALQRGDPPQGSPGQQRLRPKLPQLRPRPAALGGPGAPPAASGAARPRGAFPEPARVGSGPAHFKPDSAQTGSTQTRLSSDPSPFRLGRLRPGSAQTRLGSAQTQLGTDPAHPEHPGPARATGAWPLPGPRTTR